MTYASDLAGYPFANKLERSVAKMDSVKSPSQLQETAEASYMDLFVSGGMWRETTFGYGFGTKAKKPAALREKDGAASLAAFKTKAPQGRRTTPRLLAEVRQLADAGFSKVVIADTLNLKDDRVRKLLREAA